MLQAESELVGQSTVEISTVGVSIVTGSYWESLVILPLMPKISMYNKRLKI